ncbi:unnamed protein product, partial [Effrenium voratum]
ACRTAGRRRRKLPASLRSTRKFWRASPRGSAASPRRRSAARRGSRPSAPPSRSRWRRCSAAPWRWRSSPGASAWSPTPRSANSPGGMP